MADILFKHIAEEVRKGILVVRSMNKKSLLLKVVVVVIVLGFMLESFAIGMGGGGEENGGAEAEIAEGNADLELTVTAYRPYLYSPVLSESTASAVSQMEGVEEVVPGESQYVISLIDGYYAHGVYAQMKEKYGIDTTTIATVSMPAYFNMTTDAGESMGIAGTRFEYTMNPVADISGKFLVRMRLRASNEVAVAVIGIVPLTEDAAFSLNGTVESYEGETVTYSVPWELRDIGEEHLEGAEYERIDYVILAEPLSPLEMQSKKFEYVEYISESIVKISSNFTDKNRVMIDFGGDVQFPESTLQAEGALPEEVLNMTPDVSRMYVVAVEPGEYMLPKETYPVETEKNWNVGQEVELLVNATVLGETIVEVNSITG